MHGVCSPHAVAQQGGRCSGYRPVMPLMPARVGEAGPQERLRLGQIR